MTLTLNLSPEVEHKLRAAAAASGKSVDAFAVEMLAHGLESDITVDAVFAPLRDALRSGNIAEDEIERQLDQALIDARRDRRNEDGQ